MAQAGNTYTVSLKNTHLDWGEYRNPTNRNPIKGEAYIPIPKRYAEEFQIFNSNYKKTGWGFNLFNASSSDGFLQNVPLLAQGCTNAGDIYAKQFSVQGDLKIIGDWYKACGVTPDRSIRVEFISDIDIKLEVI